MLTKNVTVKSSKVTYLYLNAVVFSSVVGLWDHTGDTSHQTVPQPFDSCHELTTARRSFTPDLSAHAFMSLIHSQESHSIRQRASYLETKEEITSHFTPRKFFLAPLAPVDINKCAHELPTRNPWTWVYWLPWIPGLRTAPSKICFFGKCFSGSSSVNVP